MIHVLHSGEQTGRDNQNRFDPMRREQNRFDPAHRRRFDPEHHERFEQHNRFEQRNRFEPQRQFGGFGAHGGGGGGHGFSPHGGAPHGEARHFDFRYERGPWVDPHARWGFLFDTDWRSGGAFSCDGVTCAANSADAGSAFAELQNQINRFAAAGGFMPLTLDDRIDTATADAATRAAQAAALLPQVQAQSAPGTRQIMELTQGMRSPEWIAQRVGLLMQGFHFAADTAEATQPAVLAPNGLGMSLYSKPLYKKWQFWAVLAGTAAVAGGGGYLLLRHRHASR